MKKANTLNSCFRMTLFLEIFFAHLKRLAIVLFIALVFLHGEAECASRVALVVGNSNYQNSPLKNPVNDAKDMAAKLRMLSFKVLYLEDATHRQFEKTIREFNSQLEGSDIRVFYYAGHGMQINGSNYLIPTDANVKTQYDVKYESVDASWILEGMAAAGAGANIVILDACRNNPFASSFRSGNKGLARMNTPSGSVIVYATAPGDVAEDGEGRNGIFTKHLLTSIDKPGLTLEQVFKEAGKKVIGETRGRQKPWISLSLYDDIFLSGRLLADGSALSSTPSNHQSALRIESEPTGATVYIDDQKQGYTPIDIDRLNPGVIQIRLEKPNFFPVNRSLEVKAGQRVHLPLILTPVEAKARLSVIPKPQNALIRIINTDQPYKDGIALRPGEYHVEVSLEGYETYRKWITLKGGKQVSLPVRLNPFQKTEWTDPITGMVFVYVLGGCYEMGRNDGKSNEEPKHQVCLDDFWIGKYEVTQAEWGKIFRNNPSRFSGEFFPVDTVSWDKAQDFISRMNELGREKYRLPTEAEWEYVAKGGANGGFTMPDRLSSVAWYRAISGMSTHAVGLKKPNSLGVYDMLGNVMEWCHDWYESTAYETLPKKNPLNNNVSRYRVLRGGSYVSKLYHVNPYIRDRLEPSQGTFLLPGFNRSHANTKRETTGAYSHTGFRLVRMIKTVPTNTASAKKD